MPAILGLCLLVNPYGWRLIEVPPLSNLENHRWQPELSKFGPVTVVISTRKQLVIVMRNGIEIGRSKIGVVGKQPFGNPALDLGSQAIGTVDRGRAADVAGQQLAELSPEGRLAADSVIAVGICLGHTFTHGLQP